MKRKIPSFLAACLFCVLSYPAQIIHAEPPKKGHPAQSQTSDKESDILPDEPESQNAGQDVPVPPPQRAYNDLERTASIIDLYQLQLPLVTAQLNVQRGSQFTLEQLQEQPNPEIVDIEIQKVDSGSTKSEFEVENTMKVRSIGATPTNIQVPDISNEKFIYSEPLFLRSSTVISSVDPDMRQKVHFNRLTISSSSPVIFENLDISGTIHVTCRSKVIFRNCNIHNIDNNDCAVEIFSNSSGLFENCSFDSNSKSCVAIRDRSHACFNKCSITHSHEAGILVMDLSSIQVFNCDFTQCQKFAIYPYRKSLAFLQNCTFHDMSGKAIFTLNDTNIKIQECQFDRCQNGALSIAESGEAQIIGCGFKNVNAGVISLFKNSRVQVSNCDFQQITNGNGINFDFSTGEVQNCTFDTLDFPAIYVSGSGSNPVIQNCTIKNVSNGSFISIRCNATPVFKDTHIEGFTSEIPVISCSDFSGSVFQGIDFEISDKTPEIMVFNAAKVKVVPSPTCQTVCFHENGKIEEHRFSSSPKYCLHVCEKTFGQTVVLPPTNDPIMPEFIDIKSIKNYECPDIKVVSCSCGHPINICPKCGNHDHDVFNFNGENLICKNCGIIDFKNNMFKCNICKMKISKTVRQFEDNDVCAICLENPSNTVFLPCGHKCVCYGCANRCMCHKKICPICQAKTACFRYDFFPSRHE